jgi:glucokinase
MYYLGVDIGGTATKACLVDESGRIQRSKRVPTIGNDLDRFLLTLTELIVDFQKSSTLEAIGIGVAGLHSTRTQMIVVSPNIPCLVNVNLGTLVADRVHTPVVTDNDANAGAWAEFSSGAGRGKQHMVYLTLGTGLGGAIIIDGKLFRGASGFAGELGHTVIDPNGRACHCGGRGCLETVVSASAIVATATEKLQQGRESSLRQIAGPLTSALIFDAAMLGDAVARNVFDETGNYLGIACSNLINLFNPDIIVLGGGVMAAGEMLLGPAKEEARRRAFPSAFAASEIVQSQLSPHAGAIGAAMLARDRH